MSAPDRATVRDQIIESLQQKRFGNVQITDIDFAGYYRDAKKISTLVPDREVATAFIHGYARRFQEAEKLCDAILMKWQNTAELLDICCVIYSLCMSYTKQYELADRVASEHRAVPRYLRRLYDSCISSGSIIRSREVIGEMKRIGMAEKEVPMDVNAEEERFMRQHGISDVQLRDYFQAHVDSVKHFFKGQPNVFAGSNIHLYPDPETGEETLWLNIWSDIDGKTAAKISSTMNMLDPKGFTEDFKSKVYVDITRHPRSYILKSMEN